MNESAIEPRNPVFTIWQAAFCVAMSVAVTLAFLICSPNYQLSQPHTNSPYGADFLQEWVGGRMIVEGQADDLFDLEKFRRWQHDSVRLGFVWSDDSYYPPIYPPSHYLVASTLSVIPYPVAVIVWLFALVLATFGSAVLISRFANLPVHFVALALFLFPPMMDSITMGQKSSIWLFVFCLASYLLRLNRPFLAGVVFGLVSIKPTLFFLIPVVMVIKGQVRFAIGSMLTFVVLWGAAAIVLPWNVWGEYLRNLSQLSTYADTTGYRFDWSCNLLSIVPGLPIEWGMAIKFIAIPIIAGAIIYILYRMEGVVLKDYPISIIAIAATFLLSPHAYSYDLAVLLLPLLGIIRLDRHISSGAYGVVAVAVMFGEDLYGLLGYAPLPIVLIGVSAYVWNEAIAATKWGKKSECLKKESESRLLEGGA